MRSGLIALALVLGAPTVACAQAPSSTTASASSFAAARPAAFQSDRIQVSVVGKGPDVILVPGLTSSPAKAWASTVDAMPGYRYHLVQVKGFSGVPAAANANGPVAAPVAEEIARYIKEARLKAPAVVGHSMGGTIGMMLAARQAGLVGRLMVVDMTPFMGAFFGQPNGTVESLRPMAEQFRKAMSAPPTAEGAGMMEQMIAGMVNTASLRAGILEDSRNSDRAAVANSYYELMTTDLRPELSAIKVPVAVLYVVPPNVPVTPEMIDATYRSTYANLPGAQLIRIPDAAHFLQLDNAPRFQQELRTFLGEAAGGR